MARLQLVGRDRLDRDLRRYLIDGERVVVSVRKHWMSELRPALAFTGALILAVWMDINAPDTAAGASAAQAFWALWLGTCVWLGWRVLNWRRDWFIATDKRFLLFYGFIHRRVAMMPLMKVTDLTFHRSILGRILGYGDFRLESAGQDQALSRIDFIPEADRHYRAVCAVLFGDKDALFAPDDDDFDEDDDGDEPVDPRHPGGGDGHHLPPPRHPEPYAGEPAWEVGHGIPEGWEEAHADPTGESLYRSEDLLRSARLEDTGEIPVVVARPMPGARRPATPARGPRPGRRRY